MDWNAILTPALASIAVALAGAIVAVITKLINKLVAKIEAEIQKIDDEKTRALVREAFNKVETLVKATVAELEQTGQDVITQAIADGKIEDGELKYLSEVALDKVYGQLKAESKKILEAEIEDVKAYITSKIEEAVLKLK